MQSISNSSQLETDEIVLNKNLQLWMTCLPPYLKTLPIIQLAIPGSHNTMTYTIHRYDRVGPDEPEYLRFLGKYCSIIIRPLVFNWSVTQYDTVIDQLNGGIRYLDLRLAIKPDDNQIYFLHGLYGDKITQHLIDISTWLDCHPNEVLIVDCQHFYNFTEVHHRALVRRIKNIFGTKICPATVDLRRLTLEWMNSKKLQIIIIYRNEINRLETDIWPSELWPTPWPNTVRPEELVDFLDMRLKTRMPFAGYVSQCLLTPDTKYILKHMCGSLHHNLTALCRRTSLPWIQEHSPGAGGMNIVITDFVAFNDYLFSRIVIQRNIELLRGEDFTHSHSYLKGKNLGCNQP